MAEANVLVAPQNNKLERGSSVEKSISKTDLLIGNVSAVPCSSSLDYSNHGDTSGGSSPVKISTPKIKEKVIPHYLRASSGSCHDFCKYGRKLGDEPKPWHSLPKRNGKPPIDMFISNKSPVSVERKKVMAVKHIHANNVQSGGLNLSSSVCKTGKLVPSKKGQNSSQKAASTKPKNEEMSSKTLHVIKTVTAKKLGDSNVKIKRVESFPLSSNGCNQVEYEPKYVEEDNDKGVDDDDDAEANEEMDGESDAKASLLLSTNTGSTEQNGKGIALISNRNTKKKNENDIMKGNQTMSQGKGITSLTKMKFQRGRTIELQSVNYTPRKLKFRRAKVQLLNQDDKADLTKQLKMKVIANKVRVSPYSRKVVLRHRSLDDKKDAQGLFNNVIEETASKLVKSRKSKVKALVGAFETVISLQDSKPSSNVDN